MRLSRFVTNEPDILVPLLAEFFIFFALVATHLLDLFNVREGVGSWRSLGSNAVAMVMVMVELLVVEHPRRVFFSFCVCLFAFLFCE